MSRGSKNISFIGMLGAGCQVLGTIFFAKTLDHIPVFNCFPKLIGSLFFMLSGILWLLEILTQDLPESEQSRLKYAMKQFKAALNEFKPQGNTPLTWNTVAGIIAMVASALAMIGLYVMALSSPFYWVSNALIITSCVAWYYGSTPAKGQGGGLSDKLNQIAAVTQVLAIVFMVAISYAALPILSYSDLVLTLISGTAWLISYALPNDQNPSDLLIDQVDHLVPDHVPPALTSIAHTVEHTLDHEIVLFHNIYSGLHHNTPPKEPHKPALQPDTIGHNIKVDP